jgi:hypothetical protein
MSNRSRVSVIIQEVMVISNNVVILVMVITNVKVDITNNKVVKVDIKVVKVVKVVKVDKVDNVDKVDKLDPNRRIMVMARRN